MTMTTLARHLPVFLALVLASRLADAQEVHRSAASQAQALAGSVHRSLGCQSCHGEGAMEMRAAADPIAACTSCHATAQVMATDNHGTARARGNTTAPTCVTCHGSHDVLPGSDERSRTFPAAVNGRCGGCHTPALRTYGAGVHATAQSGLAAGSPAANCAACHAPHDVRRAADSTSTVSRTGVAATCGACHQQAGADYDVSVHATALRRGSIHAATCVDCHSSHAIRPGRQEDAPTAPLRVALATCGSCHDNVQLTRAHALPPVVGDYRASFHGLSAALGDRRVANCASCHGIHDIRPSWDPQSRIHPDNTPATCGACHSGVTATFARGGVHHAPDTPGHRFVDVTRAMYAALIVVLIALMAAHNALDFRRRWRDRQAEHRAMAAAASAHTGALPGVYVRFTRNERVQHWVLAGSFVTLVVTGFALKFGWNLPGVAPQTGALLRAWGHRVAAVVLLALGAYHLGYLAFTRRGRATVRALWPRFDRAANVVCCAASCVRLGPPSVSDWRDLVQMVRYNLGRTRNRPRFGRFTYAEKMEYFALLWGTVIMAVSGFVLWFEVPFLNRFPYWTLELATVVHLYEAILASLAIVVWHFYFTIVRPDVFPLSTAMITGTVSMHEMQREHPAELSPDGDVGTTQ